MENHQTIEKTNDDANKTNKKPSDGIVIEGVDNLLVRLSHCCSPVPGDEVVGYITKGRGVSVHRKDCPNINDNDERLVSVTWNIASDNHASFSANIEVQGYNRNNLLNDVIKKVSTICKQINSIEGKVDHDKTAVISLKVGVRNLEQLDMIIDHLKNIPDVYVVKRPFM